MELINPKAYKWKFADKETNEIIQKIINWFEERGKTKLLNDDFERVWYADFLTFIKENQIFAKLLTPTKYGDGTTRWDTWRNCAINEILGFYGLQYWYTWQVTILGLGPIWIGDNDKVKKETARMLREGGIFAFGLSEKEHGADIYSSEMKLTKKGENQYTANGSKYYIGNGNKASYVSIFGKSDPSFFPEDKRHGDYSFFVVKTDHENYECVQNVIGVSSYVAEYKLNDYPISDDEILAKGAPAFDMALNTVNIGKFNLGLASVGEATHCLYEAMNHASHRILYGKAVTEFPHIQTLFVEAYCRLIGMRLFALRASDYFRTASLEDRRYLLYNPMVKSWVTLQGDDVMNLMFEVIAAKGFEKDTFFSMAKRDMRGQSKLEGTVHVNIALVIKFLDNYFFNHKEYPEVSNVTEARNDDFLFNQGPTKGLRKIQFHDYKKVFDQFDLPNVKEFARLVEIFKEMLRVAPATTEQKKNFDFVLNIGKIFASIVYGQLILENVKNYPLDLDVLDEIFEIAVRDFSTFALKLRDKPQITMTQEMFCTQMISRPKTDEARSNRVWKNHVAPLKDLYEMNP